jgi:putative transposase
LSDFRFSGKKFRITLLTEERSMRRHEISDEQWAAIKGVLPGKAGDPGRTAADNRLFVNAVFWIARTGSPWRDLPERFGSWNSAFRRFSRWCKRGVWGRVLALLGNESELSNVLLDSTIVRAHQHAAGAKGGKVRKRWDAPGVASAPRSTSPSMEKVAQSNCT